MHYRAIQEKDNPIIFKILLAPQPRSSPNSHYGAPVLESRLHISLHLQMYDIA